MKIGKELDYLIKKEKRKDAVERILKVYNALLYKKGNKNGYFTCPSAYLEKVNSRYYKVLTSFIESGIIEFYSTKDKEVGDLFEFTFKKKKYYNTEKGICMKYRFLIDINEGYEYDFKVDLSSIYNNEKWFSITKKSLLELGFKPEELYIKRDSFSRRLHTNITGLIPVYQSYRNLLCGGEYYTIDSKTSQPRLLWIIMNEIGLQDNNLNYIFNNDLDFYEYIQERIPALNNDRRLSKELFTSWVNGTGYLDVDKSVIRDIFPVVNTFLRNYKTTSYKDVCAMLQYRESQIFIDNLLNNVPVDFCLSMHDSLIVKKEDVDKVLQYCMEKEPNLRFEKEEIKIKKINE